MKQHAEINNNSLFFSDAMVDIAMPSPCTASFHAMSVKAFGGVSIPAMSCECERSVSSLRRLHKYNRACMGQERLSSLALMHIHDQVKIVLDEVINLFATKHPRRLELGIILRD